jgi:hypothetical protein
LVFVKIILEKVCFVLRFVDILDGQENVARDARARAGSLATKMMSSRLGLYVCSAAKIISWMNKFSMDDVHWKLPQLFYFSFGPNLTKSAEKSSAKWCHDLVRFWG